MDALTLLLYSVQLPDRATKFRLPGDGGSTYECAACTKAYLDDPRLVGNRRSQVLEWTSLPAQGNVRCGSCGCVLTYVDLPS